jgi:hypothetical protein
MLATCNSRVLWLRSRVLAVRASQSIDQIHCVGRGCMPRCLACATPAHERALSDATICMLLGITSDPVTLPFLCLLRVPSPAQPRGCGKFNRARKFHIVVLRISQKCNRGRERGATGAAGRAFCRCSCACIPLCNSGTLVRGKQIAFASGCRRHSG